MAKHLWEVDHSYYCTEGSYFGSGSTQTVWEFKSWGEFLAEMANADMDYNLLFRWDWREGEGWDLVKYNGDDNYRHARFHMYFMHQRKGYHGASIVDVCRADEGAILEYLRPRLDHLLSLWEPVASRGRTGAAG